MKRNIFVALAIIVVGLFGADYLAAQTFGQGILRVLINGVRQPSGVSEIQCIGTSSACYRDGGVVTIVPGSGGGSGLPDGGPDNAIVRADGISTGIQTSQVTIEDDGDIVPPVGATYDGRDVSADGAKLDLIPSDAISSSRVDLIPDGGVRGTLRGSAYTASTDATTFAGCTWALPANSVCRFRAHFAAKRVPDAGPGQPTSSGYMVISRYITMTTTDTTATIVSTALVVADQLSGTNGDAAVAADATGLQFVPYASGTTLTGHWWQCTIDEIECNRI